MGQTNTHTYTIEQIKHNADLIQKTLSRLGTDIKRGHALEVSSVLAGFKDYNTAKAKAPTVKNAYTDSSSYSISPTEEVVLAKNQIAEIIIIQDAGRNMLEFSPCVIEKGSIAEAALNRIKTFTSSNGIRFFRIGEVNDALGASTIVYDQNSAYQLEQEDEKKARIEMLKMMGLRNNHSSYLSVFGIHWLFGYFPIFRAEKEGEDPAEYGTLDGGDFFSDPQEAMEFVEYFKDKINKEIPIKTLAEEQKGYYDTF